MNMVKYTNIYEDITKTGQSRYNIINSLLATNGLRIKYDKFVYPNITKKFRFLKTELLIIMYCFKRPMIL